MKQKEMNIIGAQIKKARILENLSQQQLSDKLQLSGIDICRGSISRIENGSRLVNDREISAFANTLRISPNQLFDWKEASE